MNRPRLKQGLFPLCIMLSLFVVSGQSQVASPGLFPFSPDKIAHFAVFAALATSWIRLPRFRDAGARGSWTAFALAAGFGIFDEFRQSFTPGRSVEVADALADALGAATAVLLYRKLAWWRRLLEWNPIPKQQVAGESKGG